MTQPGFDFTPADPGRERTPRIRKNRAERVIEFVTKQPYVWIHAVEFEPIGGRQAWRTAIAEARIRLEASGRGTIENRTRKGTSQSADYLRGTKVWRVSEYRFVPVPEHQRFPSSD